MSITIGAIDLSATRVPLVIPLAVASAFGVAQLFLGASPLIVSLSVAAITITFIPMQLYGRDLYSIFAAVFGIRYLGVALIAKTFYGQSLETNLFDPYQTYVLTFFLMIIETTVMMLARKLDPGRSLLPFPTDARSLRQLAIAAYSVGFVAIIIVARFKPEDSGVISAGPIFVIASAFSSLCALGFISEAAYSVERSGGRSLFTPLLLFMFIFTLLAVIALNGRGFIVSCIIGVGIVAFIYRVIDIRYVIAGLLLAAFFSLFLSPLTLYLRSQRQMRITDFIQLAEETAVKMAVDPNFRKVVTDSAKYQSLQNINNEPPYDYYGDRSNVLNRLSFVALLDKVYAGAKSHSPVGAEPLKRAIAANTPAFLGIPKPSYDLGDWLSWEIGMESPEILAYLNFGLPMEGLASWGLIGFITYPFIFMLPILLIYGRMSSFRLAVPVSIFLFTDLSSGLIEATSDGFIGIALRSAPLLFLVLFGVYLVLFPRASRSAIASRTSSSQH